MVSDLFFLLQKFSFLEPQGNYDSIVLLLSDQRDHNFPLFSSFSVPDSLVFPVSGAKFMKLMPLSVLYILSEKQLRNNRVPD